MSDQLKNPLKKKGACKKCVDYDTMSTQLKAPRQSPTNGGTFKLDPRVLELRK